LSSHKQSKTSSKRRSVESVNSQTFESGENSEDGQSKGELANPKAQEKQKKLELFDANADFLGFDDPKKP
jgi:hypothetical protein